MTFPRGIVTAAVLAGLAAGAAGTAWAAPTMSGHYIMTATSDSGETTTSDWYFTSCGDGCASVAVTAGGSAFGQVQLHVGQGSVLLHSAVVFPRGIMVPGALSR